MTNKQNDNGELIQGIAGRRLSLCAAMCLLLGGAQLAENARGQEAISAPPPKTLRDQRLELAMKIKQPFTFVAVGDMLQMVPFSKSNDPDIQYLLDLMRGADMTIANNENTVVNKETFAGPIAHLEVPAVVADDWANMGIKMMTKANNHTYDDGEEGVWSDFRELARVGIVHVGVGKNITEARMARYAATPKGTVGLVGVYADSPQILGLPTGQVVTVTATQLTQLRAIRDSIVARRKEVGNPIAIPPKDAEGATFVFGITFKVGTGDSNSGGAPSSADWLKRISDAAARRGPITGKINTLRLSVYHGVTSAQMAQLAAISGQKIDGNTLAAFGENFKVTPGPGEFSYDINTQDEREILREIRTGKQFSDFEAATIHWHQNRFAYQHYSFDHYPADFQIKFAHDAIDQGADAFVGHGVHTIKGVEIYKGKPIFYGVSNFVVQEQIFYSWRDTGAEPPVAPTGPIIGEGEVNEKSWAWMQQPDNYEALLTSSVFENGKLKEVRIYPVDVGGPERPGSQLGTPRRPSPSAAQAILEHVVEYSKPFGTKIAIEDGVGVIRIPTDAR